MSLDAQRIGALVAKLKTEEVEIFTAVIREVKSRGSAMSDATVSTLAKSYADKARQLSGDGEKP